MPSPARARPDARFTRTDYRTWPDEERWELIDGVAWAMVPAPSIRHQSVVGALLGRLEQQLRKQPCRPFVAPTDVKLSETDVVQPDVFAVCDGRKLTDSHIEGTPEVICDGNRGRTTNCMGVARPLRALKAARRQRPGRAPQAPQPAPGGGTAWS